MLCVFNVLCIFYGLYFLFLGFPLWLNILYSKMIFIYIIYVYIIEMFLFVYLFIYMGNICFIYVMFIRKIKKSLVSWRCLFFDNEIKKSCIFESYVLF